MRFRQYPRRSAPAICWSLSAKRTSACLPRADTSRHQKFLPSRNGRCEPLYFRCLAGYFCRAAVPSQRVATGSRDRRMRQVCSIVIGNPLANSPPDFPPLQTVHERFHSHGFPSFTNCYSNQQQVSCCSNVIASIPANFLSLFSLSSCCLFSCTVCMIAEIVPFCVA